MHGLALDTRPNRRLLDMAEIRGPRVDEVCAIVGLVRAEGAAAAVVAGEVDCLGLG